MMEFIRGGVTQSVINTFTQAELPTPVSRSEKLAMLVWQIRLFGTAPSEVDGSGTSATVQLTADDETAQLVFEADDLLLELVQEWRQTAQGSLSEYFSTRNQTPQVVYFAPPFLYAKASMFLNVDSVSSPSGAFKSGGVVVGYTLERVPAELFIAALVE